MLSGNGRHRRPRQGPALLVAAGVTGSAIAIPLLGATGASAAGGTTWDKVAECESGGSWSADNGTGYYGGLQITQDFWEKYGGLEYASSPDQASRSQQIAVAEKILTHRGTAPWATCALLSGLSAKSGSVDIDTGVSGDGSSDRGNSSHSSGLSDSSKSSGGWRGSSDSSSSRGSSHRPSEPAQSPSPSTPSTDADESGKGASVDPSDSPESDKSESFTPGDPQESDGSPTLPSEADDSANSTQGAGSWSLVDTGSLGGGRHRGGSADENGTKSQSAASSGRHAYTVRSGDTLASIADSLEVDGGWHALYADNRDAVGSDPNHIAPGQTLEVDAETGGK
ncbi:LysM peptidoglycan-binding domain-containing protein [Streptomyces brasiliensis]|uniref:Peptidoglycan-binding protein LysM n=1 Tax=Streptomyces brasiliensis TaxID=1954 RepID=A0A917KRH6_9ACTN|nr:transglycosylase family protein [Streptomyces brasiliensis]GGJ24099.1 peptidoglycan-binding protein LysM [Streptomyces brasiliensis]